VNNEVLDNIHEEFKTIVYTASMKVHSFQEAQGITGMKGVSEKVCYLPQGVDATVWSTWIGHHPYGTVVATSRGLPRKLLALTDNRLTFCFGKPSVRDDEL
jgi:hypothetical protein